jgi:aromatic-amino-acid transaminase
MAFGSLSPPVADPLLALMERHRADRRPHKIDLGVGVYRDAHGTTPVFAAVKRAERRLLETQDSKAYLGSEGDLGFVAAVAAELFGAAADRPVAIRGLQTVGGTGALRLAMDLLARALPGRRVWFTVPTWPNHLPIVATAGLEAARVDCADPAQSAQRDERLLGALSAAEPGDAVLVQACCHNPTGMPVATGFWRELADLVVRRQLLPVVDLAYQGLGRGWTEDVAGVREFLARVPEGLIAYSCDKNFGLYRERVGALFVVAPTVTETRSLYDTLLAIARANYSMPPDHGAAVVRIVLGDPDLRRLWQEELGDMRRRIAGLRRALAVQGRVGPVDLGTLEKGEGLFALLDLSAAQIDWLRSERAIYIAGSGRINIAGLGADDLAPFVAALRAVQREAAA